MKEKTERELLREILLYVKIILYLCIGISAVVVFG